MKLQVFGNSFGVSDYSPPSKVGLTSTMASFWLSDSCISMKPAVGTLDSLSVLITAGLNVGFLLSAFSYDTAVVVDISPKVRGTIGGRLAISGYNFGEPRSVDASIHVGKTSCLETMVISDSIITCLANEGTGSNLTVIAVIGSRTAKFVGSFSYFAPIPSRTLPSLFGSTGVKGVSIFGLMLGFHENSPKASLSRSATAQSLWTSDSSLISRVCQGAGLRLALHASISGQSGSLSNQFSFAMPVCQNSTSNIGATLSSFVTIGGINYGIFSFSSAQRLGKSACESSRWFSDSSAVCKGTSMNIQHMELRISVLQK